MYWMVLPRIQVGPTYCFSATAMGDGCGAGLSTRERRVREERGWVGNPPPPPPPRGGPPLLRVRAPGDLLFTKSDPIAPKVLLGLSEHPKTSYTYAKVRLGRFGSAEALQIAQNATLRF